MPNDPLIGCNANFLPIGVDVPIAERFRLLKATGVFDYIHVPPPATGADEYLEATRRYQLPVTTGNYIHQLGVNDDMLRDSVRNAARIGMKLLNVMLGMHAASGHELTDEEIINTYLDMAEVGNSLGVDISYEVHVDCWTEKYKRITPIAQTVKRCGVPFYLTLDYSHVIFKIENPEQQQISGVQEDVRAGRIVLDPFESGSLCEEWLSQDIVAFAQFRPVVPNNPPNIWGRNPDGRPTRGIMYPFLRPAPGEWHTDWHAYKLEACKEALRQVLRYHLNNASSPLKYLITEMITFPDYGMNARFSMLEHSAACARWIRETWMRYKAMHAAGIALR